MTKITWKKAVISIVSLLVILVMYKTAVFNGVSSINDIFINKDVLEKMYYLSQIITSVFVSVGVLVAGWQYVLSSKSEILKNRNEKVQKAIDLSEYYKDNILDKYCILFYVFTRCNMIKIIEEVKIENMNNFDIHELQDNFSKSQLDRLAEIINSDQFARIVVEASIRYNTPINEKLIRLKKAEEGNKEYSEIEINKTALVNDFMNGIVCELLNSMEFFAMHFTHNVADESVVYQSLHKTYLEMVSVLYYNIAKNNVDARKLYTNVIGLFNTWKRASMKQRKRVIFGTRNVIIKGSMSDELK